MQKDATKCPVAVSAVLAAGFLGQDYDLVVSGSRELSLCLSALANDPRWSNTHYLGLNGGVPGPNLGVGLISTHEIRYYFGALCAVASRTGVVGVVASTPRDTPLVSRGISAFALGARSVRPGIRIVAGITNDRFSYVAGRKVTTILIEQANADCILSQQLDLTVNQVSSKFGRYSIGEFSDARMFVDEYVLSSMLMHWAKAAEPFYRLLLSNQWIPYYEFEVPLSAGGVEAAGLSTLVQNEWRWQTEDIWKGLLNSSMSNDMFCTPAWNDPQYVTPQNMEMVSSNVSCMKKEAWSTMVGVTNMVELLVEFNSTHSPYILLYTPYSSVGAIFIFLLSMIVEAAVLGTSIHVLINAKHPIYRSNSPFFLIITLIGIGIGITSSLVVPGPVTKVKCMLHWWIMGISYSTVFSCILAKNWRVWKIFKGQRLTLVRILDWHLVVKWVAVIVSIEVIILICFTIFGPMVPTYSTSPRKYDVIHVTCEPTGRGYLYIIFWLYNLLILLPVVIIGYGTRHARSEYQELKPLVFTSYVAMVSILLLMAIDLGLQHRPILQFWVHGLAPILACTNAWVALYIPNIRQANLFKLTPTPSIRESALESVQKLNSQGGRYGFSIENRSTRHGPRSTASYNERQPVSQFEEDEQSY